MYNCTVTKKSVEIRVLLAAVTGRQLHDYSKNIYSVVKTKDRLCYTQ